MLLGTEAVSARGTVVVGSVAVVAAATVDVTVVVERLADELHAANAATSRRINKNDPRRMRR
jgi:hypothetical protein